VTVVVMKQKPRRTLLRRKIESFCPFCLTFEYIECSFAMQQFT